MNMKTISKLLQRDLVKGLPKLKFEKDKICEACMHGKQTKSSFHSKRVQVPTSLLGVR